VTVESAPTGTEPAPWREMSHHGLYEQINRSLLDAVDLDDGATVVDLGCGDGLISRLLLERHGGRVHIWAVDPDEGMLADTRVLIGDRVGTLAGAAESFGTCFPPGSCDAIVLANTLHLVGDRPALYRNVRHVLRPGGVFAFNTTFYLSDGMRPSTAVGMEMAWKARSLAKRRGIAVRPVRRDEPDAHYATVLPPAPALAWELRAESFDVVEAIEREWSLDMGFLSSFMTAPYQLATVVPDLDATEAVDLMREASGMIAAKRPAPVPRPWLTVVARLTDQ
jgi:SAM-dependent methyltransferase